MLLCLEWSGLFAKYSTAPIDRSIDHGSRAPIMRGFDPSVKKWFVTLAMMAGQTTDQKGDNCGQGNFHAKAAEKNDDKACQYSFHTLSNLCGTPKSNDSLSGTSSIFSCLNRQWFPKLISDGPAELKKSNTNTKSKDQHTRMWQRCWNKCDFTEHSKLSCDCYVFHSVGSIRSQILVRVTEI